MMLSPPGFRNDGNLCFASTVLHLLFNQETFKSLLDNAKLHHLPKCKLCQREGTEKCIIHVLSSLNQKYKYEYSPQPLPSEDILKALSHMNCGLKPGDQHESQEFLIMLFDFLLQNIPPEVADAFKRNAFVEMTQKVRCSNCTYLSSLSEQELFLEVQAHGVGKVSLDDLVTDSSNEELLQDGRCSSCNKETISLQAAPTSTPPHLFIHVTRTGTGLGYPTVKTQSAFLRMQNRVCYRLVGVIKHVTLTFGGHYTCYFLDRGQNQWFHANDSMVSPVTIAEVLDQSPFLLLYELCDQSFPSLSLEQCTRISSNQWFTDEIIQVYMDLIKGEAMMSGVKVCVLGSQFMEKLETAGYNGVSRWYKNVNMLQQDLLLIYINHGRCHWTLLNKQVMDMQQKQVEYYDSYHKDSPEHWQSIQYAKISLLVRVLLMENEEREFRVLLQKFVSSIDHTENRFSKYFKEHYCNRMDQWASCFRANTIVNTNMFLEAFHRTLKVVYLQQKQNRRIDFFIHILLKIAKDRVFDQLTKLEKGKFTHRVSEINKRHKSATNMDELSINITKKDENTWIVPSERDPTTRYTIKRINET